MTIEPSLTVAETHAFALGLGGDNSCEVDWMFAFRCFKHSIPCFLGGLGLLGWVKFPDKKVTSKRGAVDSSATA